MARQRTERNWRGREDGDHPICKLQYADAYLDIDTGPQLLARDALPLWRSQPAAGGSCKSSNGKRYGLDQDAPRWSWHFERRRTKRFNSRRNGRCQASRAASTKSEPPLGDSTWPPSWPATKSATTGKERMGCLILRAAASIITNYEIEETYYILLFL